MAREILYRAKRVDNGEWVQGYYVKEQYDGKYAGMSKFTNHWIYTGEIEYYACRPHESICFLIDSNTVSEFTGMTDKNGTMIFEGDIVRDIDGRIYQIKVFDYKFVADIKVYPFSIDLAHLKHCEVIGNVHDNPELLQEEN